MSNWKTWAIYCVSFLACFFSAIVIDLACGTEEDPYDYYVSFFHKGAQGEKQFKPFYFTGDLFLYDDTEPQSEADINAYEWAAYLNRGVTPADVAKAMYHLNKLTDSVLLNGFLSGEGTLPDTLANNTFLKNLETNAPALKYYRFIKAVEKTANVKYDAWNPAPLDTITLRDAGQTALKRAGIEKDSFIRLRYYYQAQRLLHYGKNYAAAKQVYDKHIEPTPSQSHIKGWALALKAGEERRLGDTIKAAYDFSRVFALYPERQLQAYKNYAYMHVKTPQVMALAADNNERAVIFAIDGFGSYGYSLTPLQKVYEYMPASPMVGVLLIREINKIEERYLTPKLHNNNRPYANTINLYNSTDSISSIAHMQRLKAFCVKLAADKKYPDASIGYIAAAYIAWMQGNTDEGSDYLKNLYDIKLNEKLNDQKQIVELLLTAQKIQVLSSANQTGLLPLLRWLQAKVKAEQKLVKESKAEFVEAPYTHTARDFYQQILAPAYLKQCDTTMAALALSKSDDMTDFWQNYLHSNHLRNILKLKTDSPHDPYLNFLTDKLPGMKLTDIYEMLGTAYLREHNYQRAIAAFRHVDAATLNNITSVKADPFIELINDYPKLYRYGQSKGYNKLQFAVAMNTLEQNIIKDPDNTASYDYKIGSGLYNTSHYGNAWYLISYNWSADDFGRTYKYYYDDDYIKTDNAEKYFVKAAQLSKTKEFKARCIFMAAKCRQKQVERPLWNASNFNSLEKNYLFQLRSSLYFEELKRNYRKTAFYKKASQECSYLKDYLRIK